MRNLRTIFFHALLFLAFIQLLTDFIGAIYAFGLLGTSIPPELATAVLLFSPIMLLLIRSPGRRTMSFLIGVLWLSRVLEPALDTRWRMMVSGLGVAAYLLLFPMLLWHETRQQKEDGPRVMMLGLVLGMLVSILLRVWGSGVDMSTQGWGQLLGVGMAISGLWLWRHVSEACLAGHTPIANNENRYNFFMILVLTLGLVAVWTLMYFAFAAPYVMARWTEMSGERVLGVLLATWLLFVLLLDRAAGLLYMRKAFLVAWNAAFGLALFWAIASSQPQFPTFPEAYPLKAMSTTLVWNMTWSQVALVVALLLSPVLFVDFHRLLVSFNVARPSMAQLGGAFSVASLFLLLAIFGHVFTTVYDYIPVVGPYFRDAFAQVYGFVVVVVLLGILATWNPVSRASKTTPKAYILTVLLLTVVIFVGEWWWMPRPSIPSHREKITILTYNIQQGYSERGQKNYAGQLAQIQAIDPDIIGLQESDAARIANSNDDIVRYFANQLDMFSYYGPKTSAGTFGIALLSRYPIREPETYYLYSEGEQVAAISAVVDVDGKPLHVFVTHLGNGGPMIQQKQFLQLMAGTSRIVALGDFNFRPDSPQYALTTQFLQDTWTLRWPNWKDDQGHRPDTKIDHIFVSADIPVLDAQYYPPGPSDHPALTAVIKP